MKTHPSFRSSRPAAFTLAEVMIALGIVASVMVGMMGMVPHAVKSIRESNSLTVMGRIAQEVIGDIQMSQWDQIDQDYAEKTFKFDNEGLVFEGKQGQLASYEARVKLPQETVNISTKADLAFSPDVLRKIEVTVEFTPGGVHNAKPEIRKKNTKIYTFFVANQNKLELK